MRCRVLLLLGILLPLGVGAQTEKVLFSAPGGFYNECFELELACFFPNHRVFFTTNGNTPTAQSNPYSHPLSLDAALYSSSDIYTIQISPDDRVFVPDSIQHCIVIRAAVFDEADHRISEVYTQSYFIRSLGCDTHGLPAVSICADSLDLFGYEQGILVPGIHFDQEHPERWTGNYYMKGREWERLANVEFYERDNTGINQQAGLRTHGGNARRFVQKGLKVYAREEYGQKRFTHRFFEETPVESFKHLVFKPYCCSVTAGGMQDYVCCHLAKGLNFESLATRPCVLFLNGEYWGIYYLQEKGDERYLEDHFDVDIAQCDIICDWWPVTLELGSDTGYLALKEWFADADLSDDFQYERLLSEIDIECFIDYYAFELFINNLDWPANNVRFWRQAGGPWRWLFFDGDAGVTQRDYDGFAAAVYVGEATWPSCTEATLFFRKLLENRRFRERFQSRFETLLDAQLCYDSTYPVLDFISTTLYEEIPNQSFRFGVPYHYTWWPPEIEKIRTFLEFRPQEVRAQLNEFIEQHTPEPITFEGPLACFPNPFTTTLKVCFDAPRSGAYPLRIFNLYGQEVYTSLAVFQEGPNCHQLEINLTPGSYLLNLGDRVCKLICY